MKRNEIRELKNKPVSELYKEFEAARDKLRSLKFDLASGKVKNVREIHIVKKDIARILTFIKMKGNKENSDKVANAGEGKGGSKDKNK